jgi:hypothetical protein
MDEARELIKSKSYLKALEFLEELILQNSLKTSEEKILVLEKMFWLEKKVDKSIDQKFLVELKNNYADAGLYHKCIEILQVQNKKEICNLRKAEIVKYSLKEGRIGSAKRELFELIGDLFERKLIGHIRELISIYTGTVLSPDETLHLSVKTYLDLGDRKRLSVEIKKSFSYLRKDTKWMIVEYISAAPNLWFHEAEIVDFYLSEREKLDGSSLTEKQSLKVIQSLILTHQLNDQMKDMLIEHCLVFHSNKLTQSLRRELFDYPMVEKLSSVETRVEKFDMGEDLFCEKGGETTKIYREIEFLREKGAHAEANKKLRELEQVSPELIRPVVDVSGVAGTELGNEKVNINQLINELSFYSKAPDNDQDLVIEKNLSFWVKTLTDEELNLSWRDLFYSSMSLGMYLLAESITTRQISNTVDEEILLELCFLKIEALNCGENYSRAINLIDELIEEKIVQKDELRSLKNLREQIYNKIR